VGFVPQDPELTLMLYHFAGSITMPFQNPIHLRSHARILGECHPYAGSGPPLFRQTGRIIVAVQGSCAVDREAPYKVVGISEMPILDR
jgi:hypothetical protein